MSWWNPFSTDANNGKSIEELQAESAALDQERRARKLAEIQAVEIDGDAAEADRLRQMEAGYEAQHAKNLDSEAAGLQESVGDAFVSGWNDAVDERRGQASSLINGTLKTVLGIVPWQIWAAAGIVATIYFWPIIKRVFFRKSA